jgi:YgiT-type zinc finger domain-containing protein
MEKQAMKCANCGKMMSGRRESIKYDECGLDYVTLANVQVFRCAECGEYEPVLKNVAGLHRLIAMEVARSPVRLRGHEIRFLRKYLGKSGAEAAKALSVKPETMSRLENDKMQISVGAERFLRLMVMYDQPTQSYPLEDLLADKIDKKPDPIRLDLKSSWRVSV